MSDEPIAKRTRLGVSRSQSESMRGAEVKNELKMLYEQCDSMMSKLEELIESVPKMTKIVNTTRTLVTEEGTKFQLREMNINVKKVEVGITCAQRGLSNIKQFIDFITIEKLHDVECTESNDCILRMKQVLIRDPLSLERKRELQHVPVNMNHKHSPLHDAVSKGHRKCIKFLLERGADVTSLATIKDDTIIHTLYTADWLLDCERLAILKLLVDYGAACMFSHNEAGTLAIRMATAEMAIEEVSLLFQHGVMLSELQTHIAIDETWKNYNLPMLKLLLLYSPYELYLGPRNVCELLTRYCFIRMILRGVPLDLCLEKFLEALKFYKAFGGKFNSISCIALKQDFRQFFRSYKHRRHFRSVKSRIKTLVSNPMSLKEISRLAVRKYIRKDYVENIKKLEVPVDLQPFLRFDNVTITNIPDNFDSVGDNDVSTSGDDEDDGDSDSTDDSLL